MRALSLTQPWASLVAHGFKHIETRSWRTPYRGVIAIHAAKVFPTWAQEVCQKEWFEFALTEMGVYHPREELPRGAVIATAVLVACRPIVQGPDDPMERAFGDYTPGRWAWFFEDVQMLPEPIPARGALGLWEWEVAA